jgi:hypothetical protein
LLAENTKAASVIRAAFLFLMSFYRGKHMKPYNFLLLLAMFVGCGGGVPLTSVTGVVTLDGNPVADAVVTFAPDSGDVACVGSTDTSGKYTLACQHGTGAPAGSYSVKIKSREKAKEGSNPMAGLSPGTPEYIEAYKKQMSGGNRADYKTKSKGEIPEKYNSGAELKATVGKSSETINFDLKSK